LVTEKEAQRMTVQYDRMRCETFISRAQERLPDVQLVKFWAFLAFEIGTWPSPAIEVKDNYSLSEDWTTMSRWEKQAVLYVFAPLVEKAVNSAAYRMSQEARKQEPL